MNSRGMEYLEFCQRKGDTMRQIAKTHRAMVTAIEMAEDEDKDEVTVLYWLHEGDGCETIVLEVDKDSVKCRDELEILIMKK